MTWTVPMSCRRSNVRALKDLTVLAQSQLGPPSHPCPWPQTPPEPRLGPSVPVPVSLQPCSIWMLGSCPVPREVTRVRGWGCPWLPRQPTLLPGALPLATFRAEHEASQVPRFKVTNLRRRSKKKKEAIKKSEGEAAHLLAGFGKIIMRQGINGSAGKLNTGQTFVAAAQLSVRGHGCDSALEGKETRRQLVGLWHTPMPGSRDGRGRQ